MEARTLIERVGLADGPSAERRARVKRRLVAALATAGAGIGGVAPAAAASAHAGAAGVALGTAGSKGALTLGSVAVWLAAGAGLGTLVSTPALVMRLKEAAERPAPAAATLSPRDKPAEEPALPRAPEPEGLPAVAAEPVPEPAARTRTASPATPAVAAAPLAEETRVLESAQRALASGHAAEALALLDEHGARFPSGALSEERGAARILALCALGRADEARRSATAFVATSPKSPLVPRLRGSCALEGAGSTRYTR